jgi:hypothetical protein
MAASASALRVVEGRGHEGEVDRSACWNVTFSARTPSRACSSDAADTSIDVIRAPGLVAEALALARAVAVDRRVVAHGRHDARPWGR